MFGWALVATRSSVWEDDLILPQYSSQSALSLSLQAWRGFDGTPAPFQAFQFSSIASTVRATTAMLPQRSSVPFLV